MSTNGKNTLRFPDDEIASQFLHWAKEQEAMSVKLISLEGLPHAGKSFLVGQIADPDFHCISLDSFLEKDGREDISWIDRVRDSDALLAVQAGLDGERCLVVEGPAAWLALEPIAHRVGLEHVRRVYLKCMSVSGEVIEWLDGKLLDCPSIEHTPFLASIYEHHHKDRPWLSANLIIERLPSS